LGRRIAQGVQNRLRELARTAGLKWSAAAELSENGGDRDFRKEQRNEQRAGK
jgi:hypothetical protein